MSIAVLNEVYTETRRLAIAGSGLAAGDFRLKKLVPPLEKAGTKAPVFAKVAEAIGRVVESDTKTASAALLELSTLVTAVLYTQGKTGIEGKLKPIETSGLAVPTANTTARTLKPLIEALTTTGSGRQEIIEDAYKRGAFRDLRLVKPAVVAIDDVYGEIADFVTDKVLPIYGQAILPELRESFDIKGKGSHVRRLRLMNALDPDGTRELVEQALDEGSKEVKVAAIECLKDSKGHLSYLLEQTKAKTKDVRRAAFAAIARFTETDVVQSLIKALSGKDNELVIAPISENRSPKLLEHVLAESRKQFDELLAATDKAKQAKLLVQFQTLLGCYYRRNEKETIDFLLDCFERREEIGKLKGSSLGGAELNHTIATLIVLSGDKRAQKKLAESHESLDYFTLECAMLAALRTMKPEQVLQAFGPYYAAKPSKGKGANIAKLKRQTVVQLLHEVASGQGRLDQYFTRGFLRSLHTDPRLVGEVQLDPRWLDEAISAGDRFLVCHMANPKHASSMRYLAGAADNLLKKSSDDHELDMVLEAMVRTKHPKATEYLIKGLEKENRRKSRYYMAFWLVRLVPDLPKSSVPALEKLVPKLNDRLADHLVPQLDELKAKK